ncbi:MAG: gas vesicle protein GvpG [Gemmatimonadota bacterium]|nr:gas vesicle protein GvpG [Gemmatimonadota bacterium]
MGLLSSILLAPFTGPWDGTMWTLDKVRRAVEEELTDDTAVKEDMMRLQLEVEAGDISDDEYLEREQAIMQRLREVRQWREKLGMSVGGGPVRVAREDDSP